MGHQNKIARLFCRGQKPSLAFANLGLKLNFGEREKARLMADAMLLAEIKKLGLKVNNKIRWNISGRGGILLKKFLPAAVNTQLINRFVYFGQSVVNII